MIIPFELFLLELAFFSSVGVFNFIKAYQKREREFYFGSLVCFIFDVSCVLLFLGQTIPSLALIIFDSVISTWRLPKIYRIVDKELRKSDFSTPLKIKDFLSYAGWVKLTNIWGIEKTVLTYFFFSLILIGGLSYVMYVFFGIMSIWYIFNFTISFSIINAVVFYLQLKKLKSEEINTIIG